MFSLQNQKKTKIPVPEDKKEENKKKEKYHYRLSDSPVMRHKAINEGIRYEIKNMKKTRKQAATSKKGRLNILRIFI